MGVLFKTIRLLVEQRRYGVSSHAAERLNERHIVEWQLVTGLSDADLIKERPLSKPNPSIEVRQHLADGTEVKVIWSLAVEEQIVKLVTVHFFDGD